MKKIYDKPTMILVKMETEHFIAASPEKVDQTKSSTEELALMWVELHQKEEMKTTATAVLPIWQNPTTPGQHGMNRRGNNP